jgi:hypothetical protein
MAAIIEHLKARRAGCDPASVPGGALQFVAREGPTPAMHGLETPSSSLVAVTYAANQWPSLIAYTRDGRLAIDNGPAEQAIRPLAVGRNNWLHIGGDGGLRPTAVLLSLAASVRRHGVNPWTYLAHTLAELPVRTVGACPADLLPDKWAKAHGETRKRAG